MSAPAFPPAPDRVAIRRALISVSDKTGLIDAAKALVAQGVEIVSTGGTRAAIAAAGLPVKDVADVTGYPEMMDGRVKTLHPAVHGALLGVRAAPDHAQAMEAHGIVGIDLLYVNLYPFEATVAGGGGFDACVENIDIGGPAMIRSAAFYGPASAPWAPPRRGGGEGGTPPPSCAPSSSCAPHTRGGG